MLALCPRYVNAETIHRLYSKEPLISLDTRLEGNKKNWKSEEADSYMDFSTVRKFSENSSVIRHRSLLRKASASDGYPSPHGKVTGWRFDLRRAAEADCLFPKIQRGGVR
jgi:hypothetical protein